MKKNITIIVSAFILIAAVFVTGCGPKGKDFGRPLTETKVTPVADILKDPASFTDKTVRVEGTIVLECPAGGWFMLKDDTGVIYVNLHPSEIAIPQAVNHRAVAEGKVKKEYTQVSVIGEGVHLK